MININIPCYIFVVKVHILFVNLTKLHNIFTTEIDFTENC